MHPAEDLYELLGLPRWASRDDVRKAHRKLVREYHPDANPGDPSSEERFKEIQQAYEVLSNEKKRREYDEGLRTTSSYSSGSSGRSHPRGAGGRSGGETASAADLSDLLGRLKDILGNARSGGSSTTEEDVSSGKPSRVNDKVQGERVKSPKTRRRRTGD